jgi:hypothetical protein
MRAVFFKAAQYEDKTMLFHEVLGLLRWQKDRFSERIKGLEEVRDLIVEASEDGRALTESETQYVLKILAHTISDLEAVIKSANEYLRYSAEPEEVDISNESYRS